MIFINFVLGFEKFELVNNLGLIVFLGFLLFGCASAHIPNLSEVVISKNSSFSIEITSTKLFQQLSPSRKYLNNSLENIIGLSSTTRANISIKLSADRNVRRPEFPTKEEQGFRILIPNPTTIEIVGTTPIGTWYGVQSLLQNSFGVLHLEGDESISSKAFPLTIKAQRLLQTPAFAIRDIYCRDGLRPSYVAANMLLPNWSTNRLPKDLNIRTGYARGYAAHSLDKWLPDSRKHGLSLCLPKTRKELSKRIIETLNANPNVYWIDLSLGDGIRKVVQNNICGKDVNEQLSNFLSEEQKEIERIVGRSIEFSILAYQGTREILPKKSVQQTVRITTETLRWSDQCKPVRENLPTASAIKNWSKRATKLIVWDYSVNFNDYDQPLPRLDVLAKDLRYYQELGLTGVFLQGDIRTGRGGWQELRNWATSQLLWNPHKNVDELIRIFIENYYQSVSTEIMNYHKLWNNSICESGYPKLNRSDYFLGIKILEKANKRSSGIFKARVKTLLISHTKFGLNNSEVLAFSNDEQLSHVNRLRSLGTNYKVNEKGEEAEEYLLRQEAKTKAIVTEGVITIGAELLQTIKLKGRIRTHATVQKDVASPTGVSVVQLGGHKVWSIQFKAKQLSLKGLYRIEVDARIEGCDIPIKTSWKGGSYRVKDKTYDFRTTVAAQESYTRILLGEATLDEQSAIYFQPNGSPECSKLHIARLILTKL